MGKFKFRDRKEGWEALKASGENYKTRDVYSNQQFERSSIDKPQTMTSRLIITVAATVMAVLFTWFVLSLVQAGLSGFHGMLGDGYDDSGGAGTTVSNVSGQSGPGTGQDGGASGGDGVVISDADEFAAIRKMDWETYRKTYYVKVGGDGTFAHTYQSLVTGEQYSMSEIYDNYFKMRDGDYAAYEQYHKNIAGEPAGNPDAGSGQDGDTASAGFDAVQKMDWSTYQKTFYTKTDAGYVNAGDGQAYSASEMYDNYMAIQNGDYVLYAKLHGSLETTAEPAAEPEDGQDAPADVSGAPVAQEPVMVPDAGQDVPVVDSEPAAARDQDVGKTPGGARGKNWFLDFSPWKVLFTLAVGLIVFSFLYVWFRKNLEAQNKLTDTGYLNQYHNDSHVQVPEEVQQAYDWFPDVGAHAPVQVSSMISHMMLMNKGIKQVRLTKRAEKDIKDGAGEVVYFKGERLVNDDGEPIVEDVPMFDEKFAHGLFDSASIPAPEDGKRTLMDVLRNRQPPPDYRIFYDARQIPYNPGDKNRDKLKGAETVADMINKYWEFPEYEPQRPGGAYVVDVAPVNTMLLAITRAGKGQTVIEPTLDMWTREMRPNNMVINDPKGELLVKFYVKGTIRGFQIVQFNLINSLKTDIYNPLGMAADAAREGDFTKVAQYVENIAEVFFPVDGGDDPVWPNAANNAFKRAAYGLIDFYLEEEKEVRIRAAREHWDDKTLETWIDTMWGKVTLYNCYQLFVQLTSKKLKNPVVEFKAREKNGDFDELKPGEDPDNLPPGREPLTDEEYEARKQKVLADSVLWEDKPDADLLTLFFNATANLPTNSMRRLIDNCNNALRSMAGAEKMLSSVYGIAITAMVRHVDRRKTGPARFGFNITNVPNWRPDGRNEGVTAGNARAETTTCARRGNPACTKLVKVGFER